MDLRKIFRQEKDKTETEISMVDLKTGDRFRMMAACPEDEQNVDSTKIFIAASDGYTSENKDGRIIGTVQTEE